MILWRNISDEAEDRWDDVNAQTNLSRNDPGMSILEQLHGLRAGFILMAYDMGFDFQWMRRLLNGDLPGTEGIDFYQRDPVGQALILALCFTRMSKLAIEWWRSTLGS